MRPFAGSTGLAGNEPALSARIRAGGHQFSMVAEPRDTTIVDHDDPVGIHHRGDALCDDNHGCIGYLLLECCAQLRIGLEIQRGKAVVEDIDFGAAHQRTGDR